MIGDEKLLVKLKNARPVFIDLPNDSQTLSTKQERVALGEKLNLGKVLFVPNVSCNLVSIGKGIKL